MYSLTIVFGTPATSWRFLFRTKERAEECNGFVSAHPTQDLKIEDDFGQCANIKAMTIHGRMLENMDESQLAYVEMQMHTWRCQLKAQERGKADASIRNAQRQGPSVLTPGMGNGMMS